MSPGHLDSSLCFIQPSASHDVYSACTFNKQGDDGQPWWTPFPYLEPACWVPCLVLTVASWPAEIQIPTDSSFFFFFFNSLTWVESERDREKTDGGTGGRTGTQAGKRKKENHERTYRPICCFPDTKRKQRTEKDTRFKMGIWKDGHPLGHFIQHPCQQKGIVSLFLSTRSFQTSETLRGGFLSPWREWLPHVP